MSLTLAGAIKAELEGLGWGLAVFRDGAPRRRDGTLATGYPYLTVQEGIALVTERHGDQGDPDADLAVAEQAQLDLWQAARVPDPGRPDRTRSVEDPRLAERIVRRLRSWRPPALGTPPTVVYGVTVSVGQRWPVADNVVRTTWTITAHRQAYS